MNFRYVVTAGCLIVATVLFQNCGGFSTGLLSTQLASIGIRADGCSQAARLFGGKCRVVNSVALSGSSVSKQTFPNFEKFVYSVSLPQAVNLVGLTGTVALDSNSASFTEALYTIGYSPSGSCPASGTRFADYAATFATMPDNKFINQYIIKSMGGHVEMPAVYDLAYPVAVSGCLFVVLDGSAGLAGTSDTMSVDLHFNVVGGDPVAANTLLGLVNYEHFASPGHPFSSTNEYLEVNKISTPIHVSSLVGSLSNAGFDFFSLTPPTGNWNTHNIIYLVRQCGAYTAGTFQDQDFFSQVPKNAITIYDYAAATSGKSVVQTSLNVPLDLDLHAGDCIVHIIAGNANGSLDFEDALAFNGAQGSNHPVIGNIDGISNGAINGWACMQGSPDSISVELYLGGVDYGTYSASQASEPSVAKACAATGTAYRFSIEIAGDIAANYAGKAVTIYGVSSNVANNNALTNSAVYKIPGGATSVAVQTPSPADIASAAATTTAAQQAAAAAAAATQQAAAAAAQAVATAAAPVAMPASPSDPVPQPIAQPVAPIADPAAPLSPVDSSGSSAAAAFAAREKVVVNRYSGPKGHVFARADATGIPTGFSLEGAAFNLYTAQYASTTQLYKCNTAGHQFLSTDSGCEGQTFIGQIGWISTVQVKGSSPLYRMRNAAGDYIEANDQAASGAGYVLDGPLGYTP